MIHEYEASALYGRVVELRNLLLSEQTLIHTLDGKLSQNDRNEAADFLEKALVFLRSER